jgi:hypothetical protein
VPYKDVLQEIQKENEQQRVWEFGEEVSEPTSGNSVVATRKKLAFQETINRPS